MPNAIFLHIWVGEWKSYAQLLDKIRSKHEFPFYSLQSETGGSLFTNLSSTLFDPAFPDSFGEMHDKGKRSARTNKFLINLFPNKVDAALLSTWKQQLDQDVDTLTMKENFNSLHRVRLSDL
ncbi:uncharacterized protein LOC124885244 [Capsicum annuum]|uniref:uncharacterized protein LOC124885244 n=1 Tax=Capsicum annuum TaxID=4072 RepID=UPI001FB1831A|nr:uncharacterized protein LOC124885244 [Capsicum annuum]